MGLFDRFLKGERASAKGSGSEIEHAGRLLEEGMSLEEKGQAEEALQRYAAAIQLKPDLARAHFNRGNILMDGGDAESALEAYTKAIEFKQDSAAAHYNMGNALLRLGRPQAAVDAYRQAIVLKPDFADAQTAMGGALEALGQPGDAIASYRRALEIDPDYAEVHSSLGNALKNVGQLDEAVASYRRVLELRPDSAEMYSNLGGVLKDIGQSEEAFACYLRALEINPDLAAVHFNFGVALQYFGRFDTAAECYRRALEIDPGDAEVHCNMGVVLQRLGQSAAAASSYRRALEIQPDNADAHMNLGAVLKDYGQLDAALLSIRRALELQPDHPVARSNLLFIHNYLNDQDVTLMLSSAQDYGVRVARLATPYTVWPNLPDFERCLHVGLVSGDLCQHPVGNFLEGVLAMLNTHASSRLAFFAYPTAACDDEVSRRIKACCHGWCPTVGLSDKSLAQCIRDDKVDILIDLSGHTAHNRLPVFAWKPAPVQATWLGYLATTGVAAIDYLIADSWTLPESEEGNFTEQIWRLSKSYLCFTPPTSSVDVMTLPALANRYVTFGSFNNLSKMNDAVVALWARVLEAVPFSRLFLKAPQLMDASVRQNTFERFAAHGIDAGRLILKSQVPRAEYLAPYKSVDIALDPFPYPGITTSVEALWMGVPVLTLAGESFLSRQGVGLLMNAGLPDWIAADPDDYLARAVAHAGDLQRLATLRSGLRQQVLASPVFDAVRFAEDFETALRGMWKKWCDQNACSDAN